LRGPIPSFDRDLTGRILFCLHLVPKNTKKTKGWSRPGPSPPPINNKVKFTRWNLRTRAKRGVSLHRGLGFGLYQYQKRASCLILHSDLEILVGSGPKTGLSRVGKGVQRAPSTGLFPPNWDPVRKLEVGVYSEKKRPRGLGSGGSSLSRRRLKPYFH